MSHPFGRRLVATTIMVSTMVIALSTPFTQAEANTGLLQEESRTVIGKGEFELPSDLVGLPQLLKAPDESPQSATSDRMAEPVALVMSTPTGNGKTIARLKNGQRVQILQSKNNWLKIRWKSTDLHHQGWLKKAFVEGNAIHAHR